jgi:AGCS family alanine or glycine:cation symporter
MLVLILGVGLFLTVGLKLLTIVEIPFGFKLLWKGRIPGDAAGEITPFNALMTSLAATIGTGTSPAWPPPYFSAVRARCSGCG